jgi:hypothetical protein
MKPRQNRSGLSIAYIRYPSSSTDRIPTITLSMVYGVEVSNTGTGSFRQPRPQIRKYAADRPKKPITTSR